MINPLEGLQKKIDKSKEDKIEEDRIYELLTPGDLVEEWAETKLFAKENPLKFGFEKVDKVLDGDLRGKVVAILGLAGSKKSLLAAQCCNINAESYNARGVISNMEMDNISGLDRLMDFAVDHYESGDGLTKIQASKYYKHVLTRDNQKELVGSLSGGLKQFYGNNLLINGTSQMTIEMYDTLIQKTIKKFGSIDMLMVDGMSMTGESGSETERYSKVSSGLKMLAKKHKILICVICHVSKTSGGKAVTPHTRDLRPFVRGSQKIIDDLDICICMSLIEDMENAGGYEEEHGYLWLHDKRGTGDVIKLVFSFNKMRLLMEQTPIDPDMVENKKEEKGLF